MFSLHWTRAKAPDGWTEGWLSTSIHTNGRTNNPADARTWKTRAGAQRFADRNPMGLGYTYVVEPAPPHDLFERFASRYSYWESLNETA